VHQARDLHRGKIPVVVYKRRTRKEEGGTQHGGTLRTLKIEYFCPSLFFPSSPPSLPPSWFTYRKPPAKRSCQFSSNFLSEGS